MQENFWRKLIKKGVSKLNKILESDTIVLDAKICLQV